MKIVRRLFFVLISLCLLVILFMGALYQLKHVEKKDMDEDARKKVPGSFVTLSGGVTHYELAGPDSAQTIVLVHGFSVPYYIWDNVFDSLVKQGFRVLRYDEFGRGYSDRPEVVYTPEFYSRQLEDLLQALHIHKPVSLAGVSFGGAIVTDFTVRHPQNVDKLILVDPVYQFKTQASSEWISRYWMAIQSKERAEGQTTDFKYPAHFPGWAEKYRDQMQYKGFNWALVSTIFHYPGQTILSNYQTLDSLHKKILLVWGKDDQTVPFRLSDSLRNLIHVEFFPVDDAAHLPYLEQPAVVIPKMSAFLGKDRP